MPAIKKNGAIRRCSYLLYLLILVISIKTEAQVNYVLNPSFEKYTRCPYEFDQIKFATGWQPIDTLNYPPLDSFGNNNCTPEYCNECASANIYTGVPVNGYFNHYARTGKGMASVMMYNDLSFSGAYATQRNYLQGRLAGPLTTGRSYCVTFYVCIELNAGYAINHIGAYLDDGMIDTTQNCGYPQTTHLPQVYAHNVISDSIHWTKIEGSFVANGTEKYITIGNFFDTAHTTAIHLAFSMDPYAFYLVDDVSVVESDIPAYAGGWMYKTKKDSLFIGRNEIVPDCMWYRNGVLIDTVHAGFWVMDTVNTMYVVKQSICGNVKYDTAWVNIANAGVNSVGNESVYRIYPNPASKEIMIQAPNNTSTVGMVVHDMSGRVMMRRDIAFVNGAYRLPIDLNSGMYMVELVSEDGVRSVQKLSVL